MRQDNNLKGPHIVYVNDKYRSNNEIETVLKKDWKNSYCTHIKEKTVVSLSCKNQYNVYKSRKKSKKENLRMENDESVVAKAFECQLRKAFEGKWNYKDKISFLPYDTKIVT